MNNEITKRKGILKIADEFKEKEPEVLKFVLKQIGFIPLTISKNPSYYYKYEGLSPKFDIISDGEKSPVYTIIIKSSENSKNPGKIESVEVRREME